MRGADEEKVLIKLINALPIDSGFTINSLLTDTKYENNHGAKISFGETLPAIVIFF